ncbi:MAG: hypothetical protein AAF620_10755 [Bacteroidota bacterium]
MKVTEKLIQKYWENKCTPDEKKAIEMWLASREREATDLDLATMNKVEDRVWNKLNENIDGDQKEETKIVPLYKKITRYAAAACIAIAIFAAGRYSTSLEYNELTSQESTNEEQGLMIYGGNGTSGKLSGNAFMLSFDGQLRLYNGSNNLKTIVVGDVTYVLEPKKSYFIHGNVEKSSMIASNFLANENIPLEGYFGLLVIKF